LAQACSAQACLSPPMFANTDNSRSRQSSYLSTYQTQISDAQSRSFRLADKPVADDPRL
jgi:hypothetical protein